MFFKKLEVCCDICGMTLNKSSVTNIFRCENGANPCYNTYCFKHGEHHSKAGEPGNCPNCRNKLKKYHLPNSGYTSSELKTRYKQWQEEKKK